MSDRPPEGAARGDARIGRLLGDRYRIVRAIGSGGMGEVYEAEQVRVKRRLAVKFLHPRYADRASMLTRFRREAEAAGRLAHENIASAIDYGDEEGVPYLVMEYLEGTDLGRLVKQEGGLLAVPRAVELVAQASRGIAAAHAAGIIHRDLKPQNLFVCRHAEGADLVKVLDFGVAKLLTADETAATHTGAALGTPCYMSPEQARGDAEIDGRTDVYSLGLILYECLTGVRPFAGDSYNAILHQVLTRVPEPLAALRPGLPPRLVAAVERAIAFELGERWESAAALGDELRRLLEELRRRDEHALEEEPLEPGMATEAQSTADPATRSARPRARDRRRGNGETEEGAASGGRAAEERATPSRGDAHTATAWIDSAAPDRRRALPWLVAAAAIGGAVALLWWWSGAREPGDHRSGSAGTVTSAATALAPNDASKPRPPAETSAAAGASLRLATATGSAPDTASTVDPSAAARASASAPPSAAPGVATATARAARPAAVTTTTRRPGGSPFDRDNPYD